MSPSSDIVHSPVLIEMIYVCMPIVSCVQAKCSQEPAPIAAGVTEDGVCFGGKIQVQQSTSTEAHVFL